MIAPSASFVSRSVRRLRIVCVLGAAIAFAVAGRCQQQVKLDQFSFTGEIPVAFKMLSEVGHVNIAVGPTIKGSITLTLKNVTVDQVMDTIAKASGLAYRYANNIYLVYPADTKTSNDPADDSQVVQLKSIAPADAVSALGVAFRDVTVKELRDKMLVLAGQKARLEEAKTFLLKLDVPSVIIPVQPTPDVSEEIYRVKSLVAQEARQFLLDRYGDQHLTVTYAPTRRDDNAPPPTATTAPTTTWVSNTFILRGPKAVVADALSALGKIDVDQKVIEARCGTKRIFATQAISYLLQQYGSQGLAVMTAPMSSVLPAGSKTGTATPTVQVGTRVVIDATGKLNVSEPIGDFILRGPDDVVKQAQATLTTLDVGPELTERTIILRFLQANEAKTRLEEAYKNDGLLVTLAPGWIGTPPPMAKNDESSSSTPTTTTATGAVTATADITCLLLRGPEGVLAKAESLLKKWDTQPAQISVSMEIISINADETSNLGVQWPASLAVGVHETQSANPLKLGRIIRDPVSLNATINALVTRHKANVINRPTTVVQNGRQAQIHVGKKVFYETLTGYSSSGAPIFSTDSIDAGVTLHVTPYLSSDGVITLNITSNVTDEPVLVKSANGSDLPRFHESSSTTSVQVPNSQTLVIGGLKESSMDTIRQEVPLLGKLPLVGALFTNTTKKPVQSELLILVTPTVLQPGSTTAPGATPPAAQ